MSAPGSPAGSVGSAAPEAGRLDRDDLRARVDALRWFHTIDLGQGVVTPGEDDTPKKLKTLRMPERLDGMSVLDIGAFDGGVSFEAERRGAERVTAVDPDCWNPPAWGPRGWGTKQPFELARSALGSKVEDRDLNDLSELSRETVGEFDVVLFLGVFYHLQNPWLILEAAASVCRKLLIVETHADMLDFRRPAMAFYPGAEIQGDPSNWWGPNPAALAGMLAEEGFSHVQSYTQSRASRLAYSAFRRLRGERFPVQAGRLVVHARR